jgi:hemolysin type calcium-binding protein
VGLRAFILGCALSAALLLPASAAAHSLVRVGGGQVNYIAKDATSLNKLKVRSAGGDIELLDRSVDGGMDPGPCRPGDTTDDINSWIVQVFCGRSGVRRVHADLGEREDSVAVSARVPTTLLGGSGADRLTGGPAGDTVGGGDGNDRLAGADGADEVDGGLGTDTLDGGPGDDALTSADGLADRIDCGEGNDRLEADTLDTVEGGCESVSRRAVPPPPGGQTGDDTTAPVVRAGGSTLQRLGRGRVRIAATSSERGFLAASGSLEVAGLALPLQSNRRRVSVAGAGVELTVRLRGRALRECRRGLRRGRRVVVRMRVVGTDAAGNSRAVRAPAIRLRR